MNILIIGSGGREHTLAWKISQSQHCSKLYVAPGNAGTGIVAENIPINPVDFDDLGSFITEKNIEMVIIGPEDPLVMGLTDYLKADEGLDHLMIIGPGEDGARLEGSKDFSKLFMNKYGIPTAKSKTFLQEDLIKALSYIETCKMPLVLKADGLAAGKGVIICNTHAEAKESMKEMFSGKFGDAGNKVLVEEYLKGIELSVFVITDGDSYKILPEAKDYKRIGEKDTGLNTGGMGSVSPVLFADKQFMQKVEERIIKPTLKGLKAEGIKYQGFIFIGLMNDDGDPSVIEYNVRMGDPETQSVFARIKSDIVELFKSTVEGSLKDYNLVVDNRFAVTVVAVSGGYPEGYQKGFRIEVENSDENTMVFHAGTTKVEGKLVTSGGRVLAVTALDEDIRGAQGKAYAALDKIRWNNIYFRRDIAQDLIRLSEKV